MFNCIIFIVNLIEHILDAKHLPNWVHHSRISAVTGATSTTAEHVEIMTQMIASMEAIRT